MSAPSPSRHLLRLHKSGCYWSEAETAEIMSTHRGNFATARHAVTFAPYSAQSQEPTGKSSDLLPAVIRACPAPFRKIFRFYRKSTQAYVGARLIPARGAARDRHERGVGCGGRGGVVRRTTPVRLRQGFGGRVPRSVERSGEWLVAYGEAVWSWRPDAGVKLAMMLRITQVTGARKPGPRGEHERSRSPTAQGMPDCLR